MEREPVKKPLYGMTLGQLQIVAAELGMPRFAARQMASWLYKKHVGDILQMTDISEANRQKLSEFFTIGNIAPSGVSESADGTKKYLFPTSGGAVETAYIPDRDRATLCVSCQAGCRMGCHFCMTAKQGLQHSLTAGEILNQFRSVPEHDSLTNIVYMGMGEPLDNTDEVLASLQVLTSDWGYGWSPSRITLSTVGVIPGIKRFLEDSSVHLAVSLHNAFHDERAEIMPVEKAYPIKDVVDTIRSYDLGRQRRVSFEYIVFEGMNDSPAHVKELARLLNGLRCRINLIRFHEVPESPFKSPGIKAMESFRDALNAKGITTTIRSSRGEDIKAACGLLSTMNTPGVAGAFALANTHVSPAVGEPPFVPDSSAQSPASAASTKKHKQCR